ncbi:hypothetical protein [Mycoplasma buteonis]|uniref:hypothetical protein n=1 Tax=Mycoplasma buteonis TaxID=171280 RepID=UPI0006905F77|nr:hypothetical protein [Mycoplasma buteonis]
MILNKKKGNKKENIPCLTKMSVAKKIIKRKYILDKSFFIFLSLLAIVISATTLIWNLWSIRFNKVPEETMDYFVAIACLTAFVTFTVSIQSFLNIQDRKNTLKENISRNQELLNEVEQGKDLTQEDIDQILNTIN